MAIFNHRQHRQLAMTSPQVRPTIPRDCTRQPQGVEVTVPSRDLLSNPEKFDDIRSHIEGSTGNLSLTKTIALLLRKTKRKNLRGTFFLKKVGMALRPRVCAHQTAVLCVTEVPNNGMAGAKKGVSGWLGHSQGNSSG